MSSLTDTVFDTLGQRAKMRRRENGQSSVEIALAIEMKPATLRLWEIRLPRKPKKELEDALEDALLVPRGWLRNAQMHPVVSEVGKFEPSMIDISKCNCETVADEIRCIGAWLSRNASRKRTCRIEELSEVEARRTRMFAERYGVSGEATLQTVGDQHGLTRERIRQVVEKMTDRLNGITFNTSCFIKLKNLVQDSEPIALTKFNEKHQKLLGEKLSLEDADKFAREILGIGIATISERSMWQSGNAIKRMVLSIQDEEDGLTLSVRDAARRMIRSCGAAQIMYVTGMVSEAMNKPVSVTDVRQSIQSIEGMEWIVEDDGWFWFGLDTVNNRAIEIARKVLAIADKRMDVEEIQQAICRSRQRRTSYNENRHNRPPMVELPRHILCDVLSHIPWLTVVQYDDFVLNEKVKPEDVLSQTELALYGFMKIHGGVASRNMMYEELIGKQNLMSVINLQVLLANSPIIRQYEPRIFILRGWEVTPEELQKVKSLSYENGSTPLKLDQKGWVEFELNMTPARLRDLLMDLPSAAMAVVPHGQYNFEGVVNGMFGIGASSTGNAPKRFNREFVRHLQDAGVKDTDVLRLRVHPESRHIIVTLQTPRG